MSILLKTFFSFFVFFFFCFFLTTHIHALTNKKPNYIPNEIIVKYKQEASPQDLQKEIQQREEKRKTFTGFFTLLINDLQMRFSKQKTPEEKLNEITTFEKSIGIVSKKKLNPQNTNERIYTVQLEKNNAEEVVEQYKKQPFIEYAQLNYIVELF